jgi:ATP-dependent DNA helicase RecQ
VAHDMLHVDHERFGALQLTEASRAVLKGEQTVHLRKMSEGKRAATKKAAGPAVALNDEQRSLWERLRSWRAVTAKAQGVPAYVVFHDATLAEVARQCPQSLDELAGISGVGAAKLERYGVDVLAVLKS